MTYFRSIFLLVMLGVYFCTSQFCASDGDDPPPSWDPSDVCSDLAFSNLSSPPIRNISPTGSYFSKHDCSIAVILDLDQRFTSEVNYGNILLFIKSMVNTCMDRGIGYKSYFYPMFNANNTETVCCEEVACGHQIAFMSYNDYVGKYDSLDPIQKQTDDANFTFALLPDLKSFAQPKTRCLYNTVVLLTHRIFDYLSNLPPDIENIKTYGCISFTIIVVGNPQITYETLEVNYSNLTQNLYVVPDFNCLPNLGECVKPCGPRMYDECINQELSNCPPPTSPAKTTTSPTSPPVSTTTESKVYEDYFHMIYLFALSNRTTQDEFTKAINYVLYPLQQCLNEKDKILVRFLAKDNSDSNWLTSYNSIKSHLEALRTQEVLLDASRAVDVYDNTTLQLVERGVNIPIYQDQKIGEPRLTLLTDFASQNFIDAYNTDDTHLIKSLERFDFEIYCFDQLAAEIYRNETVIKPAHIHSDPNFSDDKAVLVPICNKKKTNIPTIMIIVVCSCSGLMLLLIIITILYRRKYIWMERFVRFRNNQSDEKRDEEEQELEDYYEMSRNDVVVKNERLGKGAYGQVYTAKVIGTPPAIQKFLSSEVSRFTDCDCAVKTLSLPSSEQNRENFMNEINLMKIIGYHDNIITMLGCISGREPYLILELCQQGDLLQFVKQKKQEIEKERSIDLEIDCTKEYLNFSFQISQGMNYLGKKNIVHRDLAARNILLTGGLPGAYRGLLTVKISDFGLARQLDSNTGTFLSGKLPLKWMALESLTSQEFSLKTDIWSFGIVLFEMYSMGADPLAEVEHANLITFLKDGNRPTKPLLAADKVGDIMLRCWDENPDKRPTFSELGSEFAVLLEQAAEGYGYLSLVHSEEHYRILPDKKPPPPPNSRQRELELLYSDKPCNLQSNIPTSPVISVSIDDTAFDSPQLYKRERNNGHLYIEEDHCLEIEDQRSEETGFRWALRRRKSQIAALNPFKKIRQLTLASSRRDSEP